MTQPYSQEGKQEEKQETGSKNVPGLKDCGKWELKLYKYKDYNFLLPCGIKIYDVIECRSSDYFISDTIKVNGDSSLVYGYCYGFYIRDKMLLEREILGIFRGEVRPFHRSTYDYDDDSKNYYQELWFAKNGEREKRHDEEMDSLQSPDYYAKLMDKQKEDLKALEGNAQRNNI